MKKIFLALLAICLAATNAFASVDFRFLSESLGYSGTVTRFEDRGAAESGSGGTSWSVGPMGVALDVKSGTIGAMNWAKTEDSLQYSTGAMAWEDRDASTVTGLNGGFTNFNGTHWTGFTITMTGENLTADADMGFLATGDGYDGTFLEYNLELAVSGLQGVEGANGLIKAHDTPNAATGFFTGLFQHSDNGPIYLVEFEFDLNDWAGADPNNEFIGSQATPIPGAVWLLGTGLAGLAGLRRMRG